MTAYTIEIEYCHNVNFRDIVRVQAYNISNLAKIVENCYIGEDGEPAQILRIIKQEEL